MRLPAIQELRKVVATPLPPPLRGRPDFPDLACQIGVGNPGEGYSDGAVPYPSLAAPTAGFADRSSAFSPTRGERAFAAKIAHKEVLQ